MSIPKGHHEDNEKINHEQGINICRSHMMKELYPEHIKNSQKSTIRKQNQIIKGAKDHNRYLTKEHIQIEEEHMKRSSTMHVTRK